MLTPSLPHVFLAAAALLAPLVPLAAQCAPAWAPGSAAPGPDGSVLALLPLPDGSLIAGGSFQFADDMPAHHIARWNGTAWHALGNGADDAVRCLARRANGDLVAGGSFLTMGNGPCSRIARWNGSAWAPLGTGLNGDVRALCTLPNGDLVAGGDFTAAGQVAVARVAKWNGTTWSPLGAGFTSGTVQALAMRGNGELVAAGELLSGSSSGLFRWDGTAWQPVAGFDATAIADVQSLAPLANGRLALAGRFPIGGAPRDVAIWDGATLQPLTPPMPLHQPRVFAAAAGDLVVVGRGTDAGEVARWNGTTWTVVADAPASLAAVSEDAAGQLVVGAAFSSFPSGNRSVARFTGGAWQGLGAPLPPVVRSLVRLPDDTVVAGGRFTTFRGVVANNLARWNGTTWSPLGLGVDGEVSAMAATANGDLIVSGTFAHAGGAPAARIARWNGATWSTLGAGLPTAAVALAVAPDGRVHALVSGNLLMVFDGLTWSSIQVPGLRGGLSLACRSNGELAIGGLQWSGGAMPYPGLGLFDGTTFTPVPGSPLGIAQILVDDNDRLIVASAAGVRSFDGVTWTTLLPHNATALAQLPNGELLAGAAGTTQLQRQHSGGWQAFGTVVGGPVDSLVVTQRGEVFAAGTFRSVDGAVAVGFAAASATCPADIATFGAGCSGGAGPVTLRAETRPWIGSTLRTVTDGMTADSLAVQLVGLQPAVLPLPGGAPGCSLLVQPLTTSLLLPAGGSAEGAFDVPPTIAFVGLSFCVQVVGVEFDSVGIVRLTGSNALQGTIGSL